MVYKAVGKIIPILLQDDLFYYEVLIAPKVIRTVLINIPIFAVDQIP